MLDDAGEDLLAFTAFPQAHWRTIWSTNPLERVNGEIKRRTNAVGSFANDASVARLVIAVLLETYERMAVAERRILRALPRQALHPAQHPKSYPRGAPSRYSLSQLSTSSSSTRHRPTSPPGTRSAAAPRYLVGERFRGPGRAVPATASGALGARASRGVIGLGRLTNTVQSTWRASLPGGARVVALR